MSTNNELGEFLRARRAQLRPADVGVPELGYPRRVPGLRREEVAQLAGVSIDYYTRLEQGRLSPSRSALAAIARSLRLNEDQENYLLSLACHGGIRRYRYATQKAGEQTLRLLRQLRDTPAIVIGRHMDVLAWNAPAEALYLDFAAIPP
ncbi:hypothetical protein BI347_18765 [Chromobacterium sphagni]|uniref:HTH cro/C1-type domain-containing protein n=1 Tax=Chromobacterium sphagni TaxID=1903179 RepID=A0A1S1WX07_9NEIS|nr:helix-turn-helix domain-containing protein [Chromobacterium sphagni]OHX11686.1 hypothetical protein BI347_18765 [Chromobacterium sphagni]